MNNKLCVMFLHYTEQNSSWEKKTHEDFSYKAANLWFLNMA